MLLRLLICILLFVPMLSEAKNLVPCGGPGEPACQSCHVVGLVNGVVDWLVLILGTVAAIVIVYAGFKLVTSAGNTASKAQAKSLITNIFIGYVIVLSAWLIIDFGMKAMVDVGTFGVWNEVQCVEQPEAQFTESRGTENGIIVGAECELVGPGIYDCTQLGTDCVAGGGTPTYNTSGPVDTVDCSYSNTPSVYAGSCSTVTDSSNPCYASNLTMFGSRAAEASIICNKESGGAPVRSGSDLCCGPGDANCSGAPSFSGGYFQINVLAHADKIPGCTPGAFYSRNGTDGPQGDCVRRNGEGICTGWSCTITDTAMYNECMKVTTDSALNFSIAGQLFDAAGGRFNDWSWSASRCGIPL